MKETKYVIGRNNLAITIFVPYDCPNNCPFCTSKKDYVDKTDFSLTKILASLGKAVKVLGVKDIVISGGEPFADLKGLQQILDVCDRTGKNIFINTTLPVDSLEKRREILKFIYENRYKISGLNVSRHITLKTKLEDDTLLQDISELTNVLIRINSVLPSTKIDETVLIDFVKRYAPFVKDINFREDYTKIITPNHLRGLDHPILITLFGNSELDYLSSGGCLVCNTDVFKYKNVFVRLHRGYEHSLIVKNDTYIINDIIIKQNGDTLIDWSGNIVDLDEIAKYLKRDPIDKLKSFSVKSSCGGSSSSC